MKTEMRLRVKLGTLAALVCLLILAGEAFAQSRKQVTITGPGSSAVTVGNTSVYSGFVSYSYGLGGLGPRSGISSNILSSSVSSPGSYQVSRSGLGGVNMGAAGALPDVLSSTGVRLNSGLKSLAIPDMPSFVGLPTGQGGAFDSAQAYLNALNGEGTMLSATQPGGSPIVTLVPKAPSRYKDHMEAGERGLRTGHYNEAFNEFEMANDIGRHDPESFLSLMQASFASRSYSTATHFLSQAVKYLPELPLAQLQLRSFYSDSSVYTDLLIHLEDRVEQTPNDPDAATLLACYKWFDGNPDAAQALLRKAMTDLNQPGANRSELRETVEALWDGMAASGKVSGTLAPATQPASTPARGEGPASQPQPVPSALTATSEPAGRP